MPLFQGQSPLHCLVTLSLVCPENRILKQEFRMRFRQTCVLMTVCSCIHSFHKGDSRLDKARGGWGEAVKLHRLWKWMDDEVRSYSSDRLWWDKAKSMFKSFVPNVEFAKTFPSLCFPHAPASTTTTLQWASTTAISTTLTFFIVVIHRATFRWCLHYNVFPSIAPTHWGKFHTFSEACAILLHFSSLGAGRYSSCNSSQIALHVSGTILLTEARLILYAVAVVK